MVGVEETFALHSHFMGSMQQSLSDLVVLVWLNLVIGKQFKWLHLLYEWKCGVAEMCDLSRVNKRCLPVTPWFEVLRLKTIHPV